MENDLIASILRNSPKLFNNSLPRLASTVNSITPGPGAYNAVIPEFKVESFRPEALLYQKECNSDIEKSLGPYEKILVESKPQAKPVKVIHKRMDSIVE